MPFEVMDAEHRLAQRVAQRVGNARADQQRAGEPGTLGVGDAVEVAQGERRRRASTSRISGSTRRTWSREASSGTTPP